MQMINAFSEGLFNLANKYKNLVVLSGDSTRDLGLEDFSRVYDSRYFNFGLGFENMTSAAVGFTVRGKTPVLTGYSISTVGRAWEQIRNDIASPNLNIKILGYAEGAQILEDIALMRSLPNMKVLSPADYAEALSMFEAMMEDYGPSYIRISGGISSNIFDSSYEFKFGKSLVLREGTDICLFASGLMVARALEVAEKLELDGVSVSVVNVSSIKPLDEETILASAAGSKISVSLEDHNILGGLGSAISELFVREMPKKLFMIGMNDRFAELLRPEDLHRKNRLDVEGIYEQLKALKEAL